MTPDQLDNLAKAVPPAISLPQTPIPGSPAPTVNIDQELNALADIHLPDAISWWPPAPGWWLALIITLLISYFTLRLFIRQRHQRKYKKVARTELENLTRFWHKQQNIIATAARLSTLIRRIALANCGIEQRVKVASLNNQQWLLYLEKQPGLTQIKKDFSEILIELPYQDPMIKFDRDEQQQLTEKMDQLLIQIAQWIKKGFKHV